MRYVLRISIYPNATEPVYATLLVYKNQIIGGDVTNTSAQGKIHGFQTSPPPPLSRRRLLSPSLPPPRQLPLLPPPAPAATTVPATTAAS